MALQAIAFYLLAATTMAAASPSSRPAIPSIRCCS